MWWIRLTYEIVDKFSTVFVSFDFLRSPSKYVLFSGLLDYRFSVAPFLLNIE